MIANNFIRNCTRPFPIIQGMLNEQALGKIIIKNIYQAWQGENIKQIKEKHESNPYALRIGLPNTDEQMKSDAMYFILHYLSYNPLTKDIEKRELIPYRNMDKIYIGQSIDEVMYSDYKMFVDGNVIVDDLYLKKNKETRNKPLSEIILELINTTQKLQAEVTSLKRELNNRPIYNNDKA